MDAMKERRLREADARKHRKESTTGRKEAEVTICSNSCKTKLWETALVMLNICMSAQCVKSAGPAHADA